MAKVICTAATGPFRELLPLTLPSLKRYAERHGWELVIVTEDRADGRPPAWGKVPILREQLARAAVVAWIDADALVVDGSRDLADELRPRKRLYLVEHNAPTGDVTANSGVMMLRASRWANRFLAEVWAQTDLVDHIWWENAAIMRLLGYRIDPLPAAPERRTRWLGRVHFLDLAWNSIPHAQASPAPRILHYAGLPFAERRRLLADAVGPSL